MHVSYDEFEKVVTSAFEVFTSWDEEYEKVQVYGRILMIDLNVCCKSLRAFAGSHARHCEEEKG